MLRGRERPADDGGRRPEVPVTLPAGRCWAAQPGQGYLLPEYCVTLAQASISIHRHPPPHYFPFYDSPAQPPRKGNGMSKDNWPGASRKVGASRLAIHLSMAGWLPFGPFDFRGLSSFLFPALLPLPSASFVLLLLTVLFLFSHSLSVSSCA